jgi:hypothetical protein
MIPCFELFGSHFHVCIALLYILGYFHIMSDLNYLLFHFFQHVWPDCNSIYWIILVDWNLALSTIEGLERAHLQ